MPPPTARPPREKTTPACPARSYFTPGVTTRTILIPTSQDAIEAPSETFYVTLSNPSPNATIADSQGEATILERFQPVTLFADSFENGEWNGKWVEDSQNDWFASTQRATDGNTRPRSTGGRPTPR